MTNSGRASDRVRNLGSAAVEGFCNANEVLHESFQIAITSKALEDIKRLCRSGEGFCKEPASGVKFTINPALSQSFARVCTERDELNGYPLVIGRGDAADLDKIPKLSRVTTYADLDCPPGMNNSPLLIEISQEDAEKAVSFLALPVSRSLWFVPSSVTSMREIGSG